MPLTLIAFRPAPRPILPPSHSPFPTSPPLPLPRHSQSSRHRATLRQPPPPAPKRSTLYLLLRSHQTPAVRSRRVLRQPAPRARRSLRNSSPEYAIAPPRFLPPRSCPFRRA